MNATAPVTPTDLTNMEWNPQPSPAKDQTRTYLLFELRGLCLAVSSSYVTQIILMPKVVAVPNVPAYVRGMINVRDHVIRLLDLRVRLGMTSSVQEIESLIKLLDAREQDHINWLQELEASVREKREFKLARDPTKCAFGKWYHSYRPEHQTITFMALWRAFDQPHRNIHAIADKVCALAQQGDYDKAYATIEDTRNADLSEVRRLFEKARETARGDMRELAVLLRQGEERLAISVDRVHSVETIEETAIQTIPEFTAGLQMDFISRVGRRKDGQLVFLLETEKFFHLTA